MTPKKINRILTMLYLTVFIIILAFRVHAEDVVSPYQINGKVLQSIGIGFVHASDQAELYADRNGEMVGSIRAKLEPDWPEFWSAHSSAYRIVATEGKWAKLSAGGWIDMGKNTAGVSTGVVLWDKLALGYTHIPLDLDMPNYETPPVIPVYDSPDGKILADVTARDIAVYSHTSGKYADHRIVFNTVFSKNARWLEIKPGRWIRHDNFISWKDYYQKDNLKDTPSPDIISIYDQPLLLHYPSNSSDEAEDYNIAKTDEGGKNTSVTTRGKRITILKTQGKFALVIVQALTKPAAYCSEKAIQGYLGWLRFLDDNDKTLFYGGGGYAC